MKSCSMFWAILTRFCHSLLNITSWSHKSTIRLYSPSSSSSWEYQKIVFLLMSIQLPIIINGARKLEFQHLKWFIAESVFLLFSLGCKKHIFFLIFSLRSYFLQKNSHFQETQLCRSLNLPASRRHLNFMMSGSLLRHLHEKVTQCLNQPC